MQLLAMLVMHTFYSIAHFDALCFATFKVQYRLDRSVSSLAKTLSSTEESQEEDQSMSESVSSTDTMSSSQSLPLNALMSWLCTFPQLNGCGDECRDMSALLNHEDVAT
jgi:hypothetical protein